MTNNVTALNPGDYTATSGTLTFAPGETSKSFTVSLIDDVVKESNEAFNVVLGNISNANFGSPATTTITILDNDKKPRGRVAIPRVGAPRESKQLENGDFPIRGKPYLR
jgi:Calx-beta domain